MFPYGCSGRGCRYRRARIMAPPEKLKAPQAGTGEAFGFINHKQHG